MIKKSLITLILFSSFTFGQSLRFGEVKGLFMSVGVGPRIPISSFAETHNVGIGVDISFSYTDNLTLPVFIFGDVGYLHFPGSQDYYKDSDHSSISSNAVIVNLGARHYHSPLVENVILLMPVIEAGLSFSFFDTSHIYKLEAGKKNSTEDEFKFGFKVGVGMSMFLLDVMANYHYFDERQYLSFDLKVRIPIFVTY